MLGEGEAGGGGEEVQWSIVIYLNYCLLFLNQLWQELRFIISIILSALLGLVLSLHTKKFINVSLNHISCYHWQRTNPGLGRPSTPTCGVLTKEQQVMLFPLSTGVPRREGVFSSGSSQVWWALGPMHSQERRPYLQIHMILTMNKHTAIAKAGIWQWSCLPRQFSLKRKKLFSNCYCKLLKILSYLKYMVTLSWYCPLRSYGTHELLHIWLLPYTKK